MYVLIFLYSYHTYIHTCVYINMWHNFFFWRVGSEDDNQLTKHIKQGMWRKCIKMVHLSASVSRVFYRCCDIQTAWLIWWGQKWTSAFEDKYQNRITRKYGMNIFTLSYILIISKNCFFNIKWKPISLNVILLQELFWSRIWI